MSDFPEQLQNLGACSDAVEWVNGRSLRKCWQICYRGDWMLWLAAKLSIDRKLLVLAACDCAEPALEYIPKSEDRPRIAIETTRNWCDGKATIIQVRAAADAVNTASAAADAVNAAAYTASAADAAAYAAASAVNAAYAAAYAAASADARSKSRKHSAKLVRKRIPVEVIEAALREDE